MTLPPVSVIIVSRGRADHLRGCLKTLEMQDHPAFEIVLVADAAGLAQRPDLAIKRVSFDQANISAARNLGIAQAAGGIIAFIDDDSLAEPGWLSALSAPFAHAGVIAATGWTRDRDGFHWQARGHRIDGRARLHPLADSAGTVLLAPEDGAPVSTLGTNCAFRAAALRAVGGFDPALPYHLDESDVNMRMCAAFPAALTAIVPGAQVIHLRGAGTWRHADQVPSDLGRHGRSAALFIRRHGGESPKSPTDQQLSARERRRLLRHVLAGRLDPFALKPLLATYQRGLAQGRAGPLPAPPPPRDDSPPALRPLHVRPRAGTVLSGWHWQARRLRAQAARAVALGDIVTLILLSPSFLPHRLRLTSGGWFEQTGGLWGASEPGDPPAAFWRLADRLRREKRLTARRRSINS
ncbi:MAG: glycosyltransferase family A protein [Paracoccus sp. (in: a-proteobacteria)]|nr:glycosyltransferase family A protein [Paracoccus sp. (in: a-proteobacteria)]